MFLFLSTRVLFEPVSAVKVCVCERVCVRVSKGMKWVCENHTEASYLFLSNDVNGILRAAITAGKKERKLTPTAIT